MPHWLSFPTMKNEERKQNVRQAYRQDRQAESCIIVLSSQEFQNRCYFMPVITHKKSTNYMQDMHVLLMVILLLPAPVSSPSRRPPENMQT